jgi:hypothetical protein
MPTHANSLARFLWLIGLFLNIGLFAWVGILIPAVTRITLGLSTESVPSTQLIILPLVSLLLFAGGWLAGLYFYRWERERALALVVWASSALTGLLFLMAVFFIITTPV